MPLPPSLVQLPMPLLRPHRSLPRHRRPLPKPPPRRDRPLLRTPPPPARRRRRSPRQLLPRRRRRRLRSSRSRPTTPPTPSFRSVMDLVWLVSPPPSLLSFEIRTNRRGGSLHFPLLDQARRTLTTPTCIEGAKHWERENYNGRPNDEVSAAVSRKMGRPREFVGEDGREKKEEEYRRRASNF